jgi:hypothetical protein
LRVYEHDYIIMIRHQSFSYRHVTNHKNADTLIYVARANFWKKMLDIPNGLYKDKSYQICVFYLTIPISTKGYGKGMLVCEAAHENAQRHNFLSR